MFSYSSSAVHQKKNGDAAWFMEGGLLASSWCDLERHGTNGGLQPPQTPGPSHRSAPRPRLRSPPLHVWKVAHRPSLFWNGWVSVWDSEGSAAEHTNISLHWSWNSTYKSFRKYSNHMKSLSPLGKKVVALHLLPIAIHSINREDFVRGSELWDSEQVFLCFWWVELALLAWGEKDSGN